MTRQLILQPQNFSGLVSTCQVTLNITLHTNIYLNTKICVDIINYGQLFLYPMYAR